MQETGGQELASGEVIRGKILRATLMMHYPYFGRESPSGAKPLDCASEQEIARIGLPVF